MVIDTRDPKTDKGQGHERAGRSLADDLDEIALACSRRPVLDPRPADEILGCDDQGLPR